ncbi:MAG: polysaccharide deacetylase family protein [Huintestinicola sp.]
MNKKFMTAAACALILTACGQDSAGEDDVRESYIAVYQEFTDVSETVTEEETAVPVTFSPLTEENEGGYLSDVLIIGDGECGKAVSCGLLTEENVISVPGAAPDDILSAEVGGKSVRDIVIASGKPYIYLLFSERELLDSLSAEKYGSEIFELGEEIRDISPESMVIPLSVLPFSDDNAPKGDISDYNDSLHMWVRSSPDEYFIFKDISFVCGENGRVFDRFVDTEGGISPEGWNELLRYIETDRFYNNMTEDGKSYDGLYAERAEYSVTEGKVAYLTFDDGPSKYTRQILDILKKNDIKATFFITGWCTEGKENILKQVADEGHTVGLHSWSHDYDGIYSSTDRWLEDFARVYRKVYAVTGQRPWCFRFPGGSYNNFNRDTADDIIAEMDRRGFAFYDWNAATADASTSATYDSCLENIRNSINADHEVVLMHDSLKLTPEYLQDVIDYISGQGYTFETLDTADEVRF